MKVQPEMKIKVWNWVIKVFTESTDMSYLYKFPVEESDKERYGDYGDNEWWKCLEQLTDEGWLKKEEGPMNQVDYSWGDNLGKVCVKHKSIMTFGRYSKHPIFTDAHREVDGNTFYCNSCIDELQPEYERYRRQYN